MKKELVVDKRLLCLMVYICFFSWSTFAQQNPSNVGMNHLFVRIKDNQKLNTDDIFYSGLVKRYQIKKVTRAFQSELFSNYYKIYFLDTNISGLVKSLQQIEWVDYAEERVIYQSLGTPNDTATNQWYFQNISAYSAWDLAGTHQSRVAIVDDAFQIAHPDLRNNIYTNSAEIQGNNIDDDLNGFIDDVHGFDVADGDTDMSPSNGFMRHGTNVAGILGAVTNNQIGIASVSYNTASIIPVKAANAAGILNSVEEAIDYAIKIKAQIINMSFGVKDTSNLKTLRILLETASKSGIILVAAAGNDGTEAPYYPAAYNFVIGVGSTNEQDKVSKTSQYGTFIDIMAPGDSIYTTDISAKQYQYENGSSMSAPVVAAAAALVWSIVPQWTASQVTNCLLNTADNIDGLNEAKYMGKIGSGRLNIYRAMQCAKNNVVTNQTHTNGYQIFPNPSSGYIYIVLPNQVESVSCDIYTAQGVHARSLLLASKNNQVDLSQLSPGLYIIYLKSAAGYSCHKLIIQ